jgi:outer membrane protein TolC
LYGEPSICHDDPVTTPLHRATAAYRRAQVTVEQRRLDLAEQIVQAAAEGMRQVEIVEITGYTREHIRRIVDAARKAEQG